MDAVDKHKPVLAERVLGHCGPLFACPPTLVGKLLHEWLESVKVFGDVVKEFRSHNDDNTAACKTKSKIFDKINTVPVCLLIMVIPFSDQCHHWPCAWAQQYGI